MSSYTANSTTQNEKRDTPMSATSEGASNGFTAVNGPPQSPSIGRNIDPVLPNPRPQQDWQPSHPEPSTSHGPYHVGPNKRSFADMDSQEDSRRQAPPPIISSETGPNKGSETPNGDAGPGQAHAAAQSSSGWNLSEEQRMAQLLQQGDDSRPENGLNGTPNGDHMHSSDNSLQFEEHTLGDGRIITSAGVHVDMKKRKRAFTNRTKTGCQTCRRRKKKCDEAKPACNNCIRGGFTCLGYAKTRDVAKQTPNSRALNLLPAHGRDRDYPPWEVRSVPRYEASSSLPAGLPDARQSLDGRLNSTSWSSSPAYNGSTPRPMGADARLPPLQFNRPEVPPTQRYSPMNAARAGLQDLVQSQNNQNEARNYAVVPPAVSYDPNNDGYFKPDDQQYASRRKACREACGKFNRAACDGTSAEELRRLLKAIVKPDGQTAGFGGLGQGYQFPDAITVDAPFSAEYGHNLNIGKNVRIGSDCSFKDAKQITIGDGARIGSNVVITGECDPPPGQHPEYKFAATIRIGANVVIGTRSTIATGYHEIIIGDNTQVGPGCIIASRGARVSIGKDCTLGPGCVISSDVPEGTHLVAPQALPPQHAYR